METQSIVTMLQDVLSAKWGILRLGWVITSCHSPALYPHI